MVVKCMENDTGRTFEKFFPYAEKAMAFIRKVRYSKKITVLSFYKL